MKPIITPLVLALSLLGGAISATAASILDLGFASGLSGWTRSDSSLVSAAGGIATILESATASETDLSFDFKIPTGAQSLSFTLNFVNADSDQNASPPPDAFGASLLSPTTLKSLVPVVPATTDSFYIRDVVQGVTMGEAASGVTVSPSATALPLLITVNTSSLVGQNARILFRLLAGDDLSLSSVGVSLVQINGISASVPEPASVSLFTIGILSLMTYGCHRRRRTSASGRPARRLASTSGWRMQ